MVQLKVRISVVWLSDAFQLEICISAFLVGFLVWFDLIDVLEVRARKVWMTNRTAGRKGPLIMKGA